jgi:hypothetical protein
MKTSLLFVLFFSLFNIHISTTYKSGQFDKSAFYKVMSSENIMDIDNQLASNETKNFPYKDAYDGSLLMKKAGLTNNKKNQLSLFRSGKLKLENVIIENRENCEFRFLRLMIQENAPSFLGYNKQIGEDCILIRGDYKNTSALLQKIILDYNKKSKKLNLLGS